VLRIYILAHFITFMYPKSVTFLQCERLGSDFLITTFIHKHRRTKEVSQVGAMV